MGAGNLTPNYSDFGALLLFVPPVDKSNPLAKVEARVFFLLDPLDADEGSTGVLGPLAPLVPNKFSLGIKPHRLFSHSV